MYDACKKSGSKDDFKTYFTDLKNGGVFTGCTEMFILYLCFSIDVVSYSNVLQNSIPHIPAKFDVKEVLKNSFKYNAPNTSKKEETVHIYHYLFKFPQDSPSPSSQLNHFLYLQPVIISVDDDEETHDITTASKTNQKPQ